MEISRLRHYLEYTYAQFWIWGQDLQHQKKNTFLAYGFKRFPPPEPIGGKSMYVLTLGESRFLCLWAFGILIGAPNEPAFFIRRGSLRPKITYRISAAPLRYIALEELDAVRMEAKPELLARWEKHRKVLIGFLIRYEAWIETKLGQTYRVECLKRCKARSFPQESLIPTLIELNASRTGPEPVSRLFAHREL
jgi:hypothetical protein